MSQKLGKGGYFLKDVEALAPRISLDESTPASHRDQLLFAEVMAMRIALASDLFGDQTALAFRRAILSLQTIYARSICKDWKDIYRALTSEEFLQSGDWSTFKQSISTYPKWMVTPLLRHLGEGDCTRDFATALQWVKYDAKLSFRDVPTTTEAVEYLDDEYLFLKYDSINDTALLQELNTIAKEWCSTFPDEAAPFRGYHSSGTVSGIARSKSNPITKTRLFVLTPECERYLKFRTGWRENPLQTIVVKNGGLCLQPMDIPLTQDSPISVHFVPKTPLVKRVISPEDSLHMFLQADAAEQITPWLNSFHWCDLDRQELSRNMALKGSRDGSYVTVDSSKASDFVRHSQLQLILENTPLWPYYSLTRSRKATVELEDGTQTITLRKAAPMGSKICFLMEEFVFALCCELAVRKTLGRKSRKGDFRVYGDDVVIRTDCWYMLRLILSLMLYRVNDDKSFDGSGKLIFREACGIYAVNGQDVTPVQLSRKFMGIMNVTRNKHKEHGIPFATPDAASSLPIIDLLNRLTVAGLINSRRVLYQSLRSEEWLKHIWRISLSDYLEDQKRIEQGSITMHDAPCPTLITFDHVDVNFNIDATPKRWKGKGTGVFRYSRLVAITRPVEGRQGSLAYFHWSSERSKTEVGDRSVVTRDRVERLTYCSPGNIVWRYNR